ncbi:alkane 1-monooxygenase [Streptomyces niveiscabiei]|uniref:alkane 1-monooxygenase n=1 Tax=Streptomyces niveiscabiei TaxID=164115 RepID=UPI0029A74D92|nr:alkane 1-monooxygenase [Streptomyces niveiscabiei]MDX3386036.1 alkane 1-monooxygenase [Streptomyces niveiscabiei]
MSVRPQAGRDWQDSLRHVRAVGALTPLVVFQSGALAAWTGLPVFWWWGMCTFFVVAPLLERVLGSSDANPPEPVADSLERSLYYRCCLWLYVPLEYAALVWACAQWGRQDLAVLDAVGLAMTVGVTAGMGINVAHELGHKKERRERLLGRITLAPACYGHFCVEHNQGHHVRVATPEDPASSRMGESLWAFVLRSTSQGVRSAWRLERRRLTRRGRRVMGRHNDVLTSWAMSATLFTGLVVCFGVRVLPYLLIQAVAGAVLLESVNYLQHYGLLREERRPGRYERVGPRHSWNSGDTLSGILLFQMPRHSDHHARPLTRYQALHHREEAPQLPYGYSTMILLAWFPPLWRRVMDPRLLEHCRGDLSRINIHPPARRLLTERHGMQGRGVPARRGEPGAVSGQPDSTLFT